MKAADTVAAEQAAKPWKTAAWSRRRVGEGFSPG
jgi:hypothetical protein